MPLFGAHLSVAGGLTTALLKAQSYGMDTVQIFTKSPSQWAAKPIDADDAKRFRRTVRQLKLRAVTGHDSYLINLASPDALLRQRSIEAFVDEVERAELLGLKFLVMHPGARIDDAEAPALLRVAAALDEVHAHCPNAKVRVLLETTAGQGSTLGHRFEHLHQILANLREPKRVGVCLDTCHVTAAGYELSPEREYRRTLRAFDALVGLRRLRVFHLNDSVKPLGSRVDRHAALGKGHVGLEAFRLIVTDPRFHDRPMILETPKSSAESEDMDSINLAVLRGLLRPPNSPE